MKIFKDKDKKPTLVNGSNTLVVKESENDVRTKAAIKIQKKWREYIQSMEPPGDSSRNTINGVFDSSFIR